MDLLAWMILTLAASVPKLLVVIQMYTPYWFTCVMGRVKLPLIRSGLRRVFSAPINTQVKLMGRSPVALHTRSIDWPITTGGTAPVVVLLSFWVDLRIKVPTQVNTHVFTYDNSMHDLKVYNRSVSLAYTQFPKSHTTIYEGIFTNQ